MTALGNDHNDNYTTDTEGNNQQLNIDNTIAPSPGDRSDLLEATALDITTALETTSTGDRLNLQDTNRDDENTIDPEGTDQHETTNNTIDQQGSPGKTATDHHQEGDDISSE
eukprot:1706614-Heterocapsa_arctica.AAC.1